MAVIKISTFGGILPSVDPRNLPPESAQVAHNLDLRFGDFRPLRDVGDPLPGVTVVPGAKSIFRTPSGVWLSSATDTNYVNGQINDAEFERVYLTGRNPDYPEVWQQDVYYRLGVPAPRTKPTVSVVVNDEFLQADRDAVANSIVDDITKAVRLNVSELYAGNTPSGGSEDATWFTYNQVDNELTPNLGYFAYAVPATGTAAAPVITRASDSYLLDSALGGKFVTIGASTYWAIPVQARALNYRVSITGLTSYLQGVLKPNSSTNEKLFSAAQAAAIAERAADLVDVTKDPVKGYVSAINAKQGELISLLRKTDTSSGRAAAVAAARSALASAVQAMNVSINSLSANLRAYIGTILSGYQDLLPDAETRQVETRAYIYTFVNSWGEESAPSEPSELIELDQNDHVNVTCYANTPAPDEANYVALTKYRIYRSSTTTSSAEYQLVGEYDISTIGTAQLDTKLQEALEETCPTLTWVIPPTNLKGLVGLPNGIMAGFFGKTLCFSDPFHPYAWPVEYQHTVEYNIVGLGVFGQTLVVLTEGNPYYYSGADSASMSGQKMESVQACASKRSIVSVEGGVIYASPDGICIASPRGVELATMGAYDKFDWQAEGLTDCFASFSEGVYYIFVGNA